MINFSILRQIGIPSVESMVAAQYAMTADVPIKAARIETLKDHAEALRLGATLPIGSVEFIRAAMALAGMSEPENMSYPRWLRPYLRRDLRQSAAGKVIGTWFVKPMKTKEFTGFVFETLGDPKALSDHDCAQYDIFMSIPPEAQVWIGEPVTWLSEFRYYVMNGKILGEGRYDDRAEDDVPVPDLSLVEEMVVAMTRMPNAPTAFSLDVGVLDSGETALVECNDAWALGYYRGSISYRDYIEMLWCRWEQLFKTQGERNGSHQ